MVVARLELRRKAMFEAQHEHEPLAYHSDDKGAMNAITADYDDARYARIPARKGWRDAKL